MGDAVGCQIPWGALSLTLNLPAVSINLRGLSHHQRKTLNETYSRFSLVPPAAEVADIECDVFRLEKPPGLSSDELTRAGQYAPKKIRGKDSDTLNIIGSNFEAQLELNAAGKSSLGVTNEAELAHANVIENYLRIISAHRVLKQKGAVLHSAGLVLDGKAYIFSGRSNAGKTTLTHKAYDQGARVLSDDINLVLPGKRGYEAYAVPFTGEFGRTLEHAGGKESYPLAGIILLEQGNLLQTMPVSGPVAVARLLAGCPFVNTDEHESEALFDSITTLVETVPVIRLLKRRDSSFDDIMAAVKNQFSEL